MSLLLISSIALFAVPSSDWMRYAKISPNGENIAFCSKGDIYLVSVNGGQAKKLTYHKANDYNPIWNNSSTKIAFASERYGNLDVFVIDINNMQSSRLTYHSTNEIPFSFSSDDKNVLFGAQRLDDVDHRQYPTGSQGELYSVSVAGGFVNQVFTIPAEQVQLSADGKEYLYIDKKGGENYFRKHHKSAITRDIWKYNVKLDKHTQVTSFIGEDRNPIYAPGDKFMYYLSEQSNCMNVYKMEINNPSNNVQITKFKTHPVRFLSVDEKGNLCFTQNGDIYIKTPGQKAKRVRVSIKNEAYANNTKLLRVSGNAKEMSISPNGKEVAYIIRGEVFVSSVNAKMTKRITNTPEQERFVSFSADGKSVIYASERNAKWGIYQTKIKNADETYFFASTVLEEQELIVNKNENYQPEISPDGKEIAFIENKSTLKIYNIAKKKSRLIMGSDKLYYMGDGDQYFQWSPDSKWLLVDYSPTMANSEVVLISADGKQDMINLTESAFGDYSAKWINGGKQILWFSNRNGLRSQANSGRKQLDVYTMFMTKEVMEKFYMSKDEYALWKEMDKKTKEEKAKKTKEKKNKGKEDKKDDEKLVKDIKIDFDGLQDRKQRLTIHSASMADAVLSKDSEHLYYLAKFEKGYNLWTTNLRTKETKMLMKIGARSGSLMWDKDMKNLFLLAKGSISKINVKAKSKKNISISSEITLDVNAERKNMFNHVWRRAKSMFYEPSYHGIDWDAMGENYKAKLNAIGTDFEFAELLSEMLGELNVSHCGARYYGGSASGDRTASLGIFIDYDYTKKGLKIAEIVKNGPLDKLRISAIKGDVITHINDVEITRDMDYVSLLNRKAGKYVSLTIHSTKSNKESKFTVKPISLRAMRSLLYDRWIKQNEEEVAQMSNGTLAYVHLPGMNDGKYRDSYEKAMGKYFDCKALIVDTRFNGGGDLVGDLTMFLTGENFMTYSIHGRDLGVEPSYRWTKPSVAMVNEANYSDGSCFACAYQELGIGKIVGMPVPGTCSFAGWEMLQNGNVLWGCVPVSAKNKKGQWMENLQTIPELIIKNMPGVIDHGRDQQLEGAIKDLMNTVNN